MRQRSAFCRVRVTPRSSRNEVIRSEDGLIIVKVTAPPVEGEANKAVVELLSGFFRVPKSGLSVVSGASSRIKTVEINGISQNEIDEMISGIPG